MEDKNNPSDVAMNREEIATLKLDPSLFKKIKQTKRELIVYFSVKTAVTSMEDIKIFSSCRVKHNIT
jgi:hypothetical protein